VIPGLQFLSETTFELFDDATFLLNGKTISLEEIAKSRESLRLGYGKITVTYNEQDKRAGYVKYQGIEGETLASKVDVEIEV
jgi:hypothetical protein